MDDINSAISSLGYEIKRDPKGVEAAAAALVLALAVAKADNRVNSLEDKIADTIAKVTAYDNVASQIALFSARLNMIESSQRSTEEWQNRQNHSLQDMIRVAQEGNKIFVRMVKVYSMVIGTILLLIFLACSTTMLLVLRNYFELVR